MLPIERITVDEYRIRFEQHLTFQPDSLLNTTKDLLAKDPFNRDYIVNVLNCGTSTVAYRFAIAEEKEDDIVPCLGREQTGGCYIIAIKFRQAEKSTTKGVYILGSLSALAFVCFALFRPGVSQKKSKVDQAVQRLTCSLVQLIPMKSN